MKVDIQMEVPIPSCREDMIGNVYPVRGGFGARNGHVHVIIAATEKTRGCYKYSGYTALVVDSEGDIVGANHYGFHYFDEKIPMAKVDGIEDITLIMRSL